MPGLGMVAGATGAATGAADCAGTAGCIATGEATGAAPFGTGGTPFGATGVGGAVTFWVLIGSLVLQRMASKSPESNRKGSMKNV